MQNNLAISKANDRIIEKDVRTINEHNGGFYYESTSLSLEKILGKNI